MDAAAHVPAFTSCVPSCKPTWSASIECRAARGVIGGNPEIDNSMFRPSLLLWVAVLSTATEPPEEIAHRPTFGSLERLVTSPHSSHVNTSRREKPGAK